MERPAGAKAIGRKVRRGHLIKQVEYGEKARPWMGRYRLGQDHKGSWVTGQRMYPHPSGSGEPMKVTKGADDRLHRHCAPYKLVFTLNNGGVFPKTYKKMAFTDVLWKLQTVQGAPRHTTLSTPWDELGPQKGLGLCLHIASVQQSW
jgi:hypothetical protein